MTIEMEYHSCQLEEQIALKERLSIAMGNAHRNKANTNTKPWQGVIRMSPLQGLCCTNYVAIGRCPILMITRLSALISTLYSH